MAKGQNRGNREPKKKKGAGKKAASAAPVSPFQQPQRKPPEKGAGK